MKKSFLNLSVFVIGICLCASCSLLSSAGLTSKGLPSTQVPDKLTSTTANSAVNVDHAIWDELLKKHVKSNGMVDYKDFKNDREKLNKYLEMLSNQEPTKDWSVQEQLAYYINLYNAYTVDLILKNYPVKSIKDIKGAWTNDFVKVGDKTISLGGIENSILRKMKEPRIHFAINCASMSCPKLMNEAYTAAHINEQLDKAAIEFINSDKNDISKNSAKLSSIFDWYKKDFTENGTVIDYVNKFSNTKINSGVRITYKDYDWNLNEIK